MTAEDASDTLPDSDDDESFRHSSRRLSPTLSRAFTLTPHGLGTFGLLICMSILFSIPYATGRQASRNSLRAGRSCLGIVALCRSLSPLSLGLRSSRGHIVVLMVV
ncbi:unnamed protein product [Symbiodinium natans]|uniref:Uncharacterized protein n=1 Tax=Symbiodinium natans TaxID=878477 RepID=A0A812JRS4_9DINO|nr:unnamed protein product [Symbiodinium natans]